MHSQTTFTFIGQTTTLGKRQECLSDGITRANNVEGIGSSVLERDNNYNLPVFGRKALDSPGG